MKYIADLLLGQSAHHIHQSLYWTRKPSATNVVVVVVVVVMLLLGVVVIRFSKY